MDHFGPTQRTCVSRIACLEGPIRTARSSAAVLSWVHTVGVLVDFTVRPEWFTQGLQRIEHFQRYGPTEAADVALCFVTLASFLPLVLAALAARATAARGWSEWAAGILLLLICLGLFEEVGGALVLVGVLIVLPLIVATIVVASTRSGRWRDTMRSPGLRCVLFAFVAALVHSAAAWVVGRMDGKDTSEVLTWLPHQLTGGEWGPRLGSC
jgi:hypothetical protein